MFQANGLKHCKVESSETMSGENCLYLSDLNIRCVLYRYNIAFVSKEKDHLPIRF